MGTISATNLKEHTMEDVFRDLLNEFAAVVPREVIDRILSETAADFREARAARYVPALVRRLAHERLSAWVRAHRQPPPPHAASAFSA